MFLSLDTFITHTHPVSSHCPTSRQIVSLVGDTSIKISTIFSLHRHTITALKFDENDVLLLLLLLLLHFIRTLPIV
jgi:hypothetical protein